MKSDNRIMILDARNLNNVLDNVVVDLVEYIKDKYNAGNIDSKSINMIKKTLLIKALCKVMGNNNDQTIEALLPSNNILDDFNELLNSVFFKRVYTAVDDLYPNLIQLKGNVEANLDAMLSGSNLIVSIQIMEL